MKLRRRIAAAHLDPAQQRRLLQVLREVAQADGRIVEAEFELIARLLPGADAIDTPAAELESLWPHAELVVTACIYVSVADGDYCVAEARYVSALAHSLGMSAGQLARLEERVFKELVDRGAAAS